MGVLGCDDPHTPGGFLHDSREDEACVDARDIADGKNRSFQFVDFLGGIVGHAPSLTRHLHEVPVVVESTSRVSRVRMSAILDERYVQVIESQPI